MSHARYAEMLAIYRDLSDTERAEVERHVRECPECAARLEAYRAMDRELGDLAPAGPGNQARARFLAAVSAREPHSPWRSLHRAGLRLGNAAAWLIVGLVAAVLVVSLAASWRSLIAGRGFAPGLGQRPSPSRVSEYRLSLELPQDLPAEAAVYRVVAGPVPEAEWARQVAAALGFSGEPAGESRAAAQPEWTWPGPERDQVLTVYGNVGYQCSAAPAGAERTGGPETAGEAIATVRRWLAARDLLPADCAADAQAWPGVDGLGWEVRFRRRLDGRPVGSYWSWSGGLMVRLNSVGQVELMTYVRRDVEQAELAPLKTVQEAWQELQARGPALFDPEGPLLAQYGAFSIDQIDLGYREAPVGTSEEQTELRPYYVFSGQAEVGDSGQKVRMAAYVRAWR